MTTLIDSLPGLKMSVEEVPRALRHMWDDFSAGDASHLSDFRASQMNLVLHFGLETTVEEAAAKFDQALRFSQRYPCRMIVLCPVASEDSRELMEGKLFSQCYLGGKLRELCCCEALILGYSVEESNFLESQVSLWLENDLPVYHWFHRVPAERIKSNYLSFIKQCRRVVWDSSVDGENYREFAWPEKVQVRDLMWARSLPFRQHLGQWFSRTSPDVLVEGLKSVTLNASKSARPLASILFYWQKARLEACAGESGVVLDVDWTFGTDCSDSALLELTWAYNKENHFLEMRIDPDSSQGQIHASWGEVRLDHVFHLDPMADDKAIAEALFFA